MPTRVVATALVAGTLALGAVSVIAKKPAVDDTWDAAAAAQYLDTRMDIWWTKAKVLKTGEGEARCLSCHTAVSYAFARPALRRILGETGPTPNEDLIASTSALRVKYVDQRQPFYDNTEDKKTESRGVEAVVNAVVLANRDANRRPAAVSADTTAALSQMWAAQRADGAWDWLNFGLEPYEAPDAVFHGAAMAAIAAGTAGHLRTDAPSREEQAGVARLRTYFAANLASQRLFNGAWALVASAHLTGVLSIAERDALVVALKQRQRADGGWSLSDLGGWRWVRTEAPFAPPGTPDGTLLAAADGYATGLVLYALRQAAVPATDPVIVKGRSWLRSNQVQGGTSDAAWAPWRAHSLNHDREHGGPRGEAWRRMFMSDLATAFAVLGLTS